MQVQVGGHTDRGGRDHNEDAVDWLQDPAKQWALGLVADGMGGYTGGEVASTLALEVFLYRLQGWLPTALNADNDAVLEHLLQAARAANARIYSEQAAQPQLARMGTTLLCGFAWADHLALLHAGDSRCYRWREQVLARLTRDHTYVEALRASGEISEQQAATHPKKHVLTRALGAPDEFDFSAALHRTQPGDRYVLCSDGVSNALSSADWRRCLAQPAAPAVIARALIAAAKQRGADDNVSAVVLALG
ncbi:protein phosphatase 2C domain-containing protein [Simiduia sp. 21SJ11W-1]|uniref:PP2C family protein-serine/threonine phosphatase n=1 Tax=Simiduia sp. 21SJ11W-1 TaxID=2909669 RepID=UPI0020A0DB02|nr:protein phosphatase 2C domain-containing protein [Simiduia sp. 21SJ11W-1]UTA48688.1 protein phosphatase 2C domain-containing protein [Simiduia sp. 21SJ11W-1]